MLETVNCSILVLTILMVIIAALIICLTYTVLVVQKKNDIIDAKDTKIIELSEKTALLGELTNSYSLFVSNIENAISCIKEDIEFKKKEYGVLEEVTPPGEE